MPQLFIVVLVLEFGSLIRPRPHREVLKVPQQVTHTEAGAGSFAGVCGSNAFPGCSNAETQAKGRDVK